MAASPSTSDQHSLVISIAIVPKNLPMQEISGRSTAWRSAGSPVPCGTRSGW